MLSLNNDIKGVSAELLEVKGRKCPDFVQQNGLKWCLHPLNRGVHWKQVYLLICEENLRTQTAVHLMEGVRLICRPFNTGFTVVKFIVFQGSSLNDPSQQKYGNNQRCIKMSYLNTATCIYYSYLPVQVQILT